MESIKQLKKRQTITIKSDRLRIIQQAHAWAIILIPLLGSIIALGWAFQLGIGFVEIGLLAILYALTIVGISVGFHRHFAHCTFQASPAVRAILAILGSMACQGPLVYWVANHRRHHQYSDLPGDPHSPYCNGEQNLAQFRGLWHAHLGWTFNHEVTNTVLFAKDLLQDPVIARINRLYYVWVLLSLILPAVLGGIITKTWTGFLSGFLWGSCIRLFLTYHFTNSINSITHCYGNRPFNTHEQSTNNIWLAIPTGGEAWHNNHHAFPNSAIFGLKWWQIDLGGWIIRVLKFAGLIWDVKVPSVSLIEAKSNLSQAFSEPQTERS